MEATQFLYGFLSVFTITGGLFLVGAVWHYERLLKELRSQRDYYQRELQNALAKVMTVDYEKLMQLDIQARAQAAQAAFVFDKIHSNEYTNDLGEMIQEPIRVTHGRAEEERR